MRYRIAIAAGLMIVVSAQGPVSGAGQALPLQKGRAAVAIVNGEPISLDEFARQLGPSANRARLGQGRGTEAELDLLERLVTIKLIAHEGSLIGLDEVPEIRKQVEVSSREILREVLIERLVKGVTAPRAEVQKIFHDLVREWKTTSLLFKDAEAANRVGKELAGGAAFADVAARAVAAGSAKTESDDEYHAKKDYLPPIAAALAGLGVGQVSPVVRLSAGFVIVRVVDIRYPENSDALAEARSQVLRRRQLEFLQAHEKTARERHVVIDTAVLQGLDYAAARPGIPALLADKRIVAEIKGAPPVTVGDLTDYLRMQFFHGTDQAKQGRGMNARKEAALEATLGRRLLNAEALRLGIDKTPAYRDRVNGYEESLVFDSFVQKVIAPENRLKEEDIRKHYGEHPKDYSYPGMIRARSLAFTARAAAEAAVRKLGEGTDFAWLAGNAEGQVSNGGSGHLALDGRPVTIDSMPAGVQKVLASAKAGDFRLYAAPDGRFYVLSIQQVIAPAAKPYDEVREDIAKTVYAAKLKTGVEDYARKLRAQAKVQTYLHKVR